jgi:hypothetical protein
MKQTSARILFGASIGCYIISLFVPAFYDSKPQAWSGLVALISGAFGLFDGFYCWLANPLIIAVWIAALIKRPLLIAVGGPLACGLCLSFLRHHSIMMDGSGATAPIVALGPGFWLWFLAPLLMVVYAFLAPKREGSRHAMLNEVMEPTDATRREG